MCWQVKQLRVDKQVLQAHEAATNALKTCREAQGLTVERVEDTLDALAEASRVCPGLACIYPHDGNASTAVCRMLAGARITYKYNT